MNRRDYLGDVILAELEIRGPMTIVWIAQNLHESARAISASCVSLARANKIRSYKTGSFYRLPCGKKTAEVFWELGPSDNPPPRPVRKRHPVEARQPVGIDDADLEWMERYRQQAAQRREQQRQRAACPY